MAIFIRWILFLASFAVSAFATDRLEDYFLVEDADEVSSLAWDDKFDGSTIIFDQDVNGVTGTINLDIMLGTESNGNCNPLATKVFKQFTLPLDASGNKVLAPYPAAVESWISGGFANSTTYCLKYSVSDFGETTGGNMSLMLRAEGGYFARQLLS